MSRLNIDWKGSIIWSIILTAALFILSNMFC